VDVDIAPHTDDLDLASANTREELSTLLRTVHLRADKPSLRTLETQSRHGPTPLSKTVVSEMLRGTRFPRKAVMLAFLEACGIRGDPLEPWLRTWDRLAERTGAPLGNGLASAASHAVAEITNTGMEKDRKRALEVPDPQADRADKASLVDVAATEADARLLREQVSRLAADNEKLRNQVASSHGGTAPPPRPDNKEVDRIALSPPASRRELGVLLRALREAKEITVEQAAERLLCSPGKISRMESSFRSGTVRDVRDLCDLYGVPEGDRRSHLMQLARDGKGQGWWQSYDQDHLSMYIGLENDATSIKNYNSSVIPGLLQTAEYARGVERSIIEVYDLSLDRIEQNVEVRLARQRILTRTNPPNLHSIIDEAALHRSVGGAIVLRDQLDHLIKVSGLPNVSIQVIPFGVGAHPALETCFTLLEFIDPVPGLLFGEGSVGLFSLERPADVDRHRRIFKILHSIALNEEDSIRLITRLIKS
jgi:transcriptional regulator with XRE-family HTH domain